VVAHVALSSFPADESPPSYLVTSHADNTLTLHLVRSTSSSLTIDAGQRLYGHTAAVSGVLVDSRGKAVSIDRAGREMRVWELEGGVSERRRDAASVRVVPVHDVFERVGADADDTIRGQLGGFNDEKVVVLREDARLLVYDFSR
jgi:WD40 repeat protein